MKKTFRKIVLTGLMTMLGVLPTVAADGIGLTFTRTGTEAADVAVSVVDGGGGCHCRCYSCGAQQSGV